MKHLKHFNESFKNIDWSKVWLDNRDIVLDEYNRIFKKLDSPFRHGNFSDKDFVKSEPEKINYKYVDGKMIEISRNKTYMKFSDKVIKELEDLHDMEHIYDDLQDGLITDIKDECKSDVSIRLRWISNSNLDYKCKKFRILIDFKEIEDLRIILNKFKEYEIKIESNFSITEQNIGIEFELL